MKKKQPFGEVLHRSLKKTLLIMRITFILMIFGILQVHAADAYSQKTRLSFNYTDTELIRVLDNIEAESEFFFLYNEKLLDTGRKVNIKADNQLISEILDDLFSDTDIRYTIIDRKIILAPENLSREADYSSALQQNTVSGTITDAQSGESMPGVNILVKGTTIGAISDFNGKYSINIPDRNSVLVYSFIGYVNQEVPADGRTVVDIRLVSDIQNLEEVVVVGYGSQRRVTLTGSVTSVKTSAVQSSPSTNVSNALTGLLPGLTTLNRTGEPGRDVATVLIRGMSTTGSTSPLVVVDGVQGVTGWERINSNDIESISILKDASATIYGARAANGVILITTKRGVVGKPTINVTSNQGFTKPTRLAELASSATFAEWLNEYQVRAGALPVYTEEEIQKWRDGSDPNYYNTDWARETLKKFSTQSEHNVNVRGGTENVKYSVSGSFTNSNGIIKETIHNFKTYSVRSNVDININKYLKAGFDLNNAFQDATYPKETYSAFRSLPMYPVYWRNGLPSNPPSSAGNHPIVLASDAAGHNLVKDEQMGVKASFDLTIPWVKGMGVDGYYAYSKYETNGKNWEKPFLLYDYDLATDTYTPMLKGEVSKPQLTQSFRLRRNNLVNLRIKYDNIFGDHRLNTFAAVEQSDDLISSFSATRVNYLSSSIDELFAGSMVDQKTDGNSSESGRRNIFGRISYGFKDKYLVDVNIRYDGSSNFPKGKQWGLFYGISGAWRISEERFLDKFTFIDDLKLRLSSGKIGNDAIDPFQYLTLYYLGATGYHLGNPVSTEQGLVAGVNPNPNITWEAAITSNIGLDASLFKGLLGIEADVFKQRRSNILAPRELAVPLYTGLILPDENVGVVENIGFELKLSTTKIIGKLSYNISANGAFSRNRIINISEADNVPEWQKAEGKILGAEKYFLNNGILRTEAEVDAAPVRAGTVVGDLQYKDVDGNNIIDAADMVRLNKSNIPEVTFGMNASVNYNRIGLWANIAGQTRAWQYYHLNTRVAQNGFAELLENRYRPGSMDSKYPILPTLDPGNLGEVSGIPSDFWLKDASFVRLKTLELSYILPQNLLSKLRISFLKVYINGNNLITIDRMGGYKFDPESDAERGDAYPQNIIYNLGIQLTL